MERLDASVLNLHKSMDEYYQNMEFQFAKVIRLLGKIPTIAKELAKETTPESSRIPDEDTESVKVTIVSDSTSGILPTDEDDSNKGDSALLDLMDDNNGEIKDLSPNSAPFVSEEGIRVCTPDDQEMIMDAAKIPNNRRLSLQLDVVLLYNVNPGAASFQSQQFRCVYPHQSHNVFDKMSQREVLISFGVIHKSPDQMCFQFDGGGLTGSTYLFNTTTAQQWQSPTSVQYYLDSGSLYKGEKASTAKKGNKGVWLSFDPGISSMRASVHIIVDIVKLNVCAFDALKYRNENGSYHAKRCTTNIGFTSAMLQFGLLINGNVLKHYKGSKEIMGLWCCSRGQLISIHDVHCVGLRICGMSGKQRFISSSLLETRKGIGWKPGDTSTAFQGNTVNLYRRVRILKYFVGNICQSWFMDRFLTCRLASNLVAFVNGAALLAIIIEGIVVRTCRNGGVQNQKVGSAGNSVRILDSRQGLHYWTSYVTAEIVFNVLLAIESGVGYALSPGDSSPLAHCFYKGQGFLLYVMMGVFVSSTHQLANSHFCVASKLDSGTKLANIIWSLQFTKMEDTYCDYLQVFYYTADGSITFRLHTRLHVALTFLVRHNEGVDAVHKYLLINLDSFGTARLSEDIPFEAITATLDVFILVSVWNLDCQHIKIKKQSREKEWLPHKKEDSQWVYEEIIVNNLFHQGQAEMIYYAWFQTQLCYCVPDVSPQPAYVLKQRGLILADGYMSNFFLLVQINYWIMFLLVLSPFLLSPTEQDMAVPSLTVWHFEMGFNRDMLVSLLNGLFKLAKKLLEKLRQLQNWRIWTATNISNVPVFRLWILLLYDWCVDAEHIRLHEKKMIEHRRLKGLVKLGELHTEVATLATVMLLPYSEETTRVFLKVFHPGPDFTMSHTSQNTSNLMRVLLEELVKGPDNLGRSSVAFSFKRANWFMELQILKCVVNKITLSLLTLSGYVSQLKVTPYHKFIRYYYPGYRLQVAAVSQGYIAAIQATVEYLVITKTVGIPSVVLNFFHVHNPASVYYTSWFFVMGKEWHIKGRDDVQTVLECALRGGTSSIALLTVGWNTSVMFRGCCSILLLTFLWHIVRLPSEFLGDCSHESSTCGAFTMKLLIQLPTSVSIPNIARFSCMHASRLAAEICSQDPRGYCRAVVVCSANSVRYFQFSS